MTIAQMMVVAWCISVALTDAYARRIPNTLTLGVCLIAIAWLLVTGHSMLNANLPSVALGVTASLLLTLPAYAARLLGAGDVKLLLSIALIGGSDLTLFAFVIAAMLAMLFGIVHILLMRLSDSPITPGRRIPFGAALSTGLLFAIGMAT